MTSPATLPLFQMGRVHYDYPVSQRDDLRCRDCARPVAGRSSRGAMGKDEIGHYVLCDECADAEMQGGPIE